MPRYRLEHCDTDVLTLAYERLEQAYKLFDTIGVSFSGGKDSTVCLNLVTEVAKAKNKLPVPVLFFDEEALPIQTGEYMSRVYNREDVDLRWLCIPVHRFNTCSPEEPVWWPWDPDIDPNLWVRPMPKEAITHLEGFKVYPKEDRLDIPGCNHLCWPPQEYGRVGMVMGIRTQESLIRYKALCRRKEENYMIQIGKTNITKVYPIYDWRTEDVWTAPAKFGWDYNTSYDVMEMCGMSHLGQRIAPPFGAEQMGALWTFKVCFPEVWEKLLTRVKGVATAALYAKTELYSYGGMPQKPPELTWKEYIKMELDKWPEVERRYMANRIQSEIKIHHNKTKDPILGPPHPYTGVGYQFLCKLAQRGDFFDRKEAISCVMGKDQDVLDENYRRALKHYRETGEIV